MKKVLSIIAIIAITVSMSFAQDETPDGWKKGGMTSVNLSQVSLTNWAAGGNNSLSGNLLINGFANLKKGKFTWENTLDFGYGIVKQGELTTRKSDDKIELASKFGQHAFKHWYYSGLFNFKTQVSPGYNYSDDSAIDDVQISDIMAPGYFNLALGMDYKPNEKFSALISPVSGKITVVSDTLYSVAYGLDQGESVRTEFGAYAKVTYKTPVMENIGLQTKLDLFSNYLENPQNIDVSWEVLLTMKINKWFSANLSTNLLYDDDIDIVDADGNVGPMIQFKEVFGVGFTANF